MRNSTLALAALALSGCVQTVAVNGELQPKNAIPDKSVEAVGVVCSPALLSHTAHGRSWLVAYELPLGQSLCRGLVEATRGAYRSAESSVEPYKGQYARVIKYDLARSSLDFESQPDGSRRVAYGVEVVVEKYSRDLRLQSRNVVAGNALVDGNSGTREECVQRAAAAALQEVVDKTTGFLVAGLGDGPRQHKKAAKQTKTSKR
ncbi:MAG TPA: hypothetical protein VMR86_07210 [Myxococcota bacterium]|nr:hypothetical protein [Myxococcota bacterium]